MQIVVTFEDYDEMVDFAKKIQTSTDPVAETVKKAAEAPAKPEQKPAKAAQKPAKAEQPADKFRDIPKEDDELPFGDEPDPGEVDETMVKVLLSEKLKAGKKAAVKKLFAQYGVEKLSELIEKHPDKLAVFYKDAEVI